MADIRWNGPTYEMVLAGGSAAPPEVVYDTLADLSTHMEWAGRRQRRGFRLIRLDAAGPARGGSEFTSVGTVPMSLSRADNRNRVTQARRPDRFEFETHTRVAWRMGRVTVAEYAHSYRIEPRGGGSRVVYRLRQTHIANPPARMSLPLVSILTHRLMIPLLCGRGFKSLLRLSEERVIRGAAAPPSRQPADAARDPNEAPAVALPREGSR